MQKAGGITAIIAGIFAVFAALFTLMVGGAGGAFEQEGADTVIALGWGGVVFSFATIILGAVCISAASAKPGVILILASIAGAILGGTFVALFMVLAFVGGILAAIGGAQTKKQNLAAKA
ncbi:hypothetical protein LRF89_12210 [Halorhodospira sp. 9621]|uniref:hypothetical protein n=1 Tax=Halorhodospira sp. 9621 TaxID=2899135 RepID=UPI001EE94D46|nr:hypothetical protein [Halorhodospira sp. 9621]MCG5534198.1 hypothetical protein [Halorhodospira sp. 9621]